MGRNNVVSMQINKDDEIDPAWAGAPAAVCDDEVEAYEAFMIAQGLIGDDYDTDGLDDYYGNQDVRRAKLIGMRKDTRRMMR